MESTELRRIVLALILCNFLLPIFGEMRRNRRQFGTLIGNFTDDYGVKGQVYAVDDTTLYIKGFVFDGRNRPARFYVGKGAVPAPNGIYVPYPDNFGNRMEMHNNTNILLKLPQGKKVREIRWLSLWYERFAINFGHVSIPEDIEIPKPRLLPEFTRIAHGLSSGNISILDSKTIYIPNLHYDGTGPDAYFWVGNGSEPNSLGIRVPNEVGSLKKLRMYQGEDIEIVLPDNLTVYDIQWLSVWCVPQKRNFGHVFIPRDLEVPPAMGQTKITTISPPPVAAPPRPELTNCKEMLNGRVQVQWQATGDDVYIRLSGRVKDNHWVAFGLSGQEGRAQMLYGDVVVAAYVTKTNKFIAEDYYLSNLSQCDGKKGVCPDERIGGRNDVVLRHGQRKNGVTTVEYKRPMRTNEPILDRMIPETETSVIAAIGPLNEKGEASPHKAFDKTIEDTRIDFTSSNVQECTNLLHDIPERSEIAAWPPAIIDDKYNFTVRIGPAGGDRGYSRITGLPSWRIAWYINDLLIPEIMVERGETYTFVIEGGDNPNIPSKYHPFYITDSPDGGYGKKTENQQAEEKVFAGVEFDEEGYPYPTAAGRYCGWVDKDEDMSSQSPTFEIFFETLRLVCDEGEPAKLVWTVAEDTPDLVYYQCYMSNNLGWKIFVVDAGYLNKINGAEESRLLNLATIFLIVVLRLTFLR